MTLESPEPNAQRPPWWWRVLSRLGVVSVWSAGLLVSVVALALLGVLWLSRQPSGHRMTFALANRALARSTNLRLSARRSLLIEHGAYLVGPMIELVDSTGVRHPFLTAARARLVSSWWGLLTRNPGDFRVELTDPVITLTRRRSGGYVLPEFRPGPKNDRAPTPLAIDLGLKNALVLVVGAGEPVDTLVRALSLTGRAHGAGGTWDFALGRCAAEFPGARLAVTKADGRLRLSEGRLALDHLRVRTDAGWLEADGGGALGSAMDLEGRVRVGEWAWHDLATILRQPALELAGGVAGEARVHIVPGRIELAGAQADVLWRDEPARVRFDGALAAGRVTLTGAQVAWRKSTFAGGMTVEPAAHRWRLTGSLGQLELAELPRLWPMPALDPLLVSGDVDLLGTPRGLEARVARGRGVWREVEFDSLGGTWTLVGHAQTIDARARGAGARLAARGTIGARDLAGVVRLTGLDAGRIPTSWWRGLGLDAAPAGRLETLEAQVTGPHDRPTVRGTALVVDVRNTGVELDHAALDFVGRLGPGYEVKLSALMGEARVGFAAADTSELDLTVTPQRIDVSRFWAERAESTLTLSGSATRAGDAWDARIERIAWGAGERIRLDNDGPVEFRLEPGGVVVIRRAHVVSTAGALSATGRWGGRHSASDLSLELEKLDLESLLGPLAARYELRGVITGHARLEGVPPRATWTVDIDASDMHYRTYTARRFVARGRFADDGWGVEHLELDTGRGRLLFAGDIAWDQPAPWSGDGAAWDRALMQSPRWSGTLTTDSLSLAQISEFYPQAGGWRGDLSTTLTLSGRPSAPIVGLKGRLVRPGWGQGSLDDFDLDLDYRDEVLSVRRCAMVGPDSLGPTVSGTLPIRLGWGLPADERLPDRPMSLKGHARGLDLGLLPLVLPQIAAATGKLDFEASLTGTPRAPYVKGTVGVREGVVRPASREEVLTGVTGTVRLDGAEIRIAHFEARQGKRGRITVTPGGIAHLENLRVADYKFGIAASHATAFSSGEYVIELDGMFQVENGPDLGGPLPLPRITGHATVIEGVFLANFADPGRQAAWQGPAVVPPWTYDVTVEARNNVWWRPSDANVEGELEDFEVIQSLDRFLLLGGVKSLRGRYYFLGNQFDVKVGELFFDTTEPMNPTVNATLTVEKPLRDSRGGGSEVITLSVSGRAQEPTVTMTSEPSALSQGEIAQLLTSGQIGTGAIQTAAVGYLARQVASQIPELSQYVGVIDVGTTVDATLPGASTTKTYTNVGVSRYFTRDLLLRYSQVVGDVTEAQRVDYQDLEAEYRISRLLFVSGEVTRQKGQLVTSSQEQTLYKMNLRARHEY